MISYEVRRRGPFLFEPFPVGEKSAAFPGEIIRRAQELELL